MEDHTPVWPLWQSIYITCFQRPCWWQISQGVSTSLIGTLNFTLVQHQIIAGVKQPYIHTLTQKQSRALKDGKVELVVMFQKMHGTHSFKKPPCNLEYTTLCRRQAKMTKKLKPREWVGLKCSECTEFIPAVTNQAESGLQALIWATDSDGFHQLSPNREREHEKKKRKKGKENVWGKSKSKIWIFYFRSGFHPKNEQCVSVCVWLMECEGGECVFLRTKEDRGFSLHLS